MRTLNQKNRRSAKRPTKKRTYFAVLSEEAGQFKVTAAEEVFVVNQFRALTCPTNSRELARQINKARLVIN